MKRWGGLYTQGGQSDRLVFIVDGKFGVSLIFNI